MSTLKTRFIHNLRIVGLGIVMCFSLFMIWRNTQTASLTDVLDVASADMKLYEDDTHIRISTLKTYQLNSGAMLRIGLLRESQQPLETIVYSPYSYFIADHAGGQAITIYLPDYISDETDIVTLQKDGSGLIVDSISLLDGETRDDVKIYLDTPTQTHSAH